MVNRLAQESSPYLLQHADNPVDWWPWCEEALALARQEDKPILLSIGYSACHWCHVMAHESFEDPVVAARMNQLFINIKVDREERLDLDQIYQTAHQLLAGKAGGWPLTLFMTPDGTPFFGGTYFPREARYGLAGIMELLERVGGAYRQQRKAIEHQNASLRGALARLGQAHGGIHSGDLNAAPLNTLADQLAAAFDENFGGFGAAPKFSRPADLAFLLARYRATGDERARDMALTTLTRMAEGGIFDQLGGGFFRYSVDARWSIPHFEKMLYDNGLLLGLYAEAWALTGEPLYQRVAEGIAGWVMAEMQGPEGGYFTALDADSEGREGRYYVWGRDEIRARLSPEVWPVVEAVYGLDLPANFEGRHWHLGVARPVPQVAVALGLEEEIVAQRLAEGRRQLQSLRQGRARPGCDDKILTGWNALMIQGMVRAARVFQRPDWLDSAQAATNVLRAQLWRDERLLATCRQGPGRLNAYLDDHAYLMAALVELLQVRFCLRDLAWAEDLADALLESFEDRERGGFYFTRHDHEALIQRPKPWHDDATPAGNGVAARALLHLGHLTGESRYLDAARRVLQAFHGAMAQEPAGCASLALALGEYLLPPTLVVLRGSGPDLEAWQRHLDRRLDPAVLVLALPVGLAGLPPVLDKPLQTDPCGWVCQGVQCFPPIADLAGLDLVLGR
ncbi:MAG: thioredoxin domain-containing protein [Rhodocyclaceae bacterium]|jgi:uncharacterized protein YyaL (SSP411 family)|nr:thioredoxin domain-containing protein [Rhodocyclaceae bacterium]